MYTTQRRIRPTRYFLYIILTFQLVMDPVYSNRIEAAKEVRAPVMRTRRKENEMTELRTNLQM